MGLTARFSNPVTPGQSSEVAAEPTHGEDVNTDRDRKPFQKQRRLEEPEILRLIADYISGSSITALAKTWGIHRTTVMAHLDRHGVERRPVKKALTSSQLEKATRSYEQGDSLATLGKRYGLDAQTMNKMLRAAGVEIRARRGWSG